MFKVTKTDVDEAAHTTTYWLKSDEDEWSRFGVVVKGPDCEASQEIIGSVVLGLALLDEYLGEDDEGDEPKAGRQRGGIRARVAERRKQARLALGLSFDANDITEEEYDKWTAKLDAQEEEKTESILVVIAMLGLLVNILNFLRNRRKDKQEEADRKRRRQNQ